MYWTDWEEDPTESNRGKIKKAWMDGSHHQVFLTSKTVLWPNGLSLDIPQGILYWVDAYYDRIELIYLNTTERKVGIAGGIYLDCGIFVYLQTIKERKNFTGIFWTKCLSVCWNAVNISSTPISFLIYLQVVYEGQELNHAFGLCHYKQFLFWNEYRGGSIYKLDQVTKTVTLLRNERPPIFEIRVYDAHQQQGMSLLLIHSHFTSW